MWEATEQLRKVFRFLELLKTLKSLKNTQANFDTSKAAKSLFEIGIKVF